jgi:hypothetical protein
VAKSATTAGERRVLAHASAGTLVDLSGLPDEERVVSPDVIRRLCVGPEAKEVDPRGLRIKGAHIVGPLDLSFCTIPHPLRFEATTFDAAPDLTEAHLPALWIDGCSLPGLQAYRIQTDTLSLESSDIKGEVLLMDARIGGQLNCSGATLTNEGDSAFSADGAEIGGFVFLNGGFSATGAVGLSGAKIGGALSCSGATLTNEGDNALFADGAEIRGIVNLRGGFRATGAVWLLGARIGGSLDCSGATLTHEGDNALVADGAEITGSLNLRDGSRAIGTVRLPGARIGGNLDCSGATLTNEGDNALIADGAEITGSVHLRDGFSATGAVRLLDARIGGQLDCSGATLTHEGDNALIADLAEITGSVQLTDGFSATGGVGLSGTKIRSQLNCSGATLTHEGENALVADGAEIGGEVFLSDGFNATGTVRLPNARIGGNLTCNLATLANGGDNAMFARGVTIDGALIFHNVSVTGGLDLFRARATTLHDDLGQADHPLGSWSAVAPLVLDSFAYARFAPEAEWDSTLRRQWLEQTTGFQQGAWQQLIEVYRAHGRDDEATRAAIAMHNDRVKRAGLPWYRRWGRRVLRVTVGHGYRPWLAGIWAAAIIAAFALVVWNWAGMFVPETGGLGGSPQPVAYAADTFLPIVDLGEAGDWMPTGWVRWVDWSVILLGWALSTIFVAGFTRIVRS